MGIKDVKSNVAPRNGCDGRLTVKILIATIQVNFVPIDKAATNSPELLLLKILPLTYHHSHFLAATLDFTSFFHHSLFEGRTLFLQLGCFGLDTVNRKILHNYSDGYSIPESPNLPSF